VPLRSYSTISTSHKLQQCRVNVAGGGHVFFPLTHCEECKLQILLWRSWLFS